MEIGVEKSSRLRDRRPSAQHRAHDRADPDGLDLLADPQGEFHRRRHARRPVGRFRPPDARDRDQRFDHARRCALRSGQRSSPTSCSCSSTSRPKRSRSPTAPASEWDVPVETLNLSVRSFNCLKRAGISKVSELLDMTEDEIIKMRNFGKKSLDEIKASARRKGPVAAPSRSDERNQHAAPDSEQASLAHRRTPPGAAAQPGDLVLPAREDRDDDDQGEGDLEDRRAPDHAGAARRSALAAVWSRRTCWTRAS